MSNLADDIAAFEADRANLEANHLGKWAVFHDKELFGIFPEMEIAAAEAVRRFGQGPYLIRQIGAPPIALPASVMYHPVHAYDEMRF